MKTWRRDFGRLLAVFHSPKHTFTEIGETPSVTAVVAAMLLLFAVGAIARIIRTGDPTLGSREVELFLIPLVVIGWPFVVSALYLFVFDLFGVEARYGVVLSVGLHAVWAISVLGVALVLVQFLAGAPPFDVREYLMSSIGVDERLARDLARVLNPLEVARLLLTGLGFAIALRAARWMCFAIVFAGWLGFHSLPLVRFLLF